MIRLALFLTACLAGAAGATPDPELLQKTVKKGADKGVKKIEASFTPAEAKPGQTVTFSLKVELNDGYHTYPTVQEDKGAESFVNTFKFPEPAKVIFVGALQDPEVKAKFEPDLKCKIQYCSGTVIYKRKAVVSPKAEPGNVMVNLPECILSICDEENCFPPKKVKAEATLKVLDGPAVPVEKEYVNEVNKALGEK